MDYTQNCNYHLDPQRVQKEVKNIIQISLNSSIVQHKQLENALNVATEMKRLWLYSSLFKHVSQKVFQQMTIIRNMVADNLIASWTSFNNNIYEIPQFLLFKNNIRYDMFYWRRFLPEIYKIPICKRSSIMNVWCQ